ncbi:MAG: MBL fold metallo-hydrolase [Candidatus Azobacteroides pseudotrichonymphae]|jgi:glyoxylase-like metal-dependent hydrolase (beta-lactamase superfamily II)|nr:MBL fold metallo-hydrolase [Bacteroidales bacterium OttesenSCG-928-I14]GMO32278.1 MAG: MBL fold metallo-hydrolase [Candidatus Azobacteroides pseudotrichonymphae]
MQVKLFEFNSIRVNTYLVYDETKEAILIDCGTSTKDECMELKGFIDFHNLQLKHLFNTHLHFDHMLGNYFVYKTYGLRPQYHQLEESIPNLKAQATLFGFSIDYQPISANHYLNEGDTIPVFGNITLRILSTAGHSPGGLSFYFKENNCIFTGDALFYHGIGRTDLWGGNYDLLIDSIKEKILTLPNKTKIFPGHGQFSTVEEEKQYNPYIRI